MAIKPQSAKAKGRILQQRCAAMITEIFDLEEGDLESRPMGSGGADLMASPAARRKFPVTIECKNTKKVPAMDEIRQASYNAYKDTLPIVAWKPPRVLYDDTLVVMRLKDFAEWWKKHVHTEKKTEVNKNGVTCGCGGRVEDGMQYAHSENCKAWPFDGPIGKAQ